MSTEKENELLALSGRVRYRSVGDEGVLVHLESGNVIVINAVGLFIVEQLKDESVATGELARLIADEFDVSVEQARSDLDSYVTDLLEQQIVERAA